MRMNTMGYLGIAILCMFMVAGYFWRSLRVATVCVMFGVVLTQTAGCSSGFHGQCIHRQGGEQHSSRQQKGCNRFFLFH